MAVLACREFLDLLRVVIDFFQIIIDKVGSVGVFIIGFSYKVNVNEAIKECTGSTDYIVGGVKTIDYSV
jgi:hypothetical protein